MLLNQCKYGFVTMCGFKDRRWFMWCALSPVRHTWQIQVIQNLVVLGLGQADLLCWFSDYCRYLCRYSSRFNNKLLLLPFFVFLFFMCRSSDNLLRARCGVILVFQESCKFCSTWNLLYQCRPYFSLYFLTQQTTSRQLNERFIINK